MAAINASRDQLESETKFIVWKNEYSVGVTKLNNQHMKIIHILNDIYDYQKKKTISLDLENILNELLTYTKTHFTDEENLLRLVEYPDFVEHKKHHEWMAQKAQVIRDDYLKCREDLSWELMDFLKKWWLNHILNIDMRYVPYLV
jgi:hemerythrin-like metal-binding protein